MESASWWAPCSAGERQGSRVARAVCSRRPWSVHALVPPPCERSVCDRWAVDLQGGDALSAAMEHALVLVSHCLGCGLT
eukprot:3987770-Pyramimonas_sp.AAC.1